MRTKTMRDKFFLLSALLIVFFVLLYLFPLNISVDNKKSTYLIPASIKEASIISSPSAFFDQGQVLYELGKTSIENVNSSFNILLTICLVILTIIGIGLALAALFTSDRFKEIDRLLKEATLKNEEANKRIREAQAQGSGEQAQPPDAISADEGNLAGTQTGVTAQTTLPQQEIDLIKQAHFEKTYRLIFGSQLAILRLLLTSPNYMSTSEVIQTIYRRSKYSDIPFQDYIAFLINSVLIGLNEEGNYYLTQLGMDFLNYLFQNGIPDKVEV